ncbi:prolipoprotein diacylglyceryl transferase [Dehalococcoidia bacterium]|nr:prolipoprotein diacylglyceryl transferase [Dehalococcoidia bacterium]
MSLVEININPIMLEEPVRISWYGVFIIAAIILGLSLALKLAKRYEVTPSQILSFFVAAFLGGVIGARLVHVVCALDFYLARPELIPQIWLGGFSQFGMILGGLISVVIYAYWKKCPLIRFLDLLPVPLLVGISIGRVGCIIQGCCHGGPTDLPWSFVFLHPDSFIPRDLLGVPLHPTQAYEIVWFLALAGILLGRRKHLQPIKGLSFLIFLVGHSVGRFLIFFTRGDHADLQVAAGLTQVQIIAVVIFLIAISVLIARWRKSQECPTENATRS